jgi:hypothetical protein
MGVPPDPPRRRGSSLNGSGLADPIPLSPNTVLTTRAYTRMGAFNGEVATVIAQMLSGRHVAAYSPDRVRRAVPPN